MSIPSGYLPILPLRNTVVFPGIHQVLRVGRMKSVKAVLQGQRLGDWIICASQKKVNLDEIEGLQSVYPIAVLCRIESMKGNEEQGLQVVVRGYQKIQLNSVQFNNGYFEGLGEGIGGVLGEAADIDEGTQKSVLQSLKETSLAVLDFIPGDTTQLKTLVEGVEDLSYLVYLAAANLDVSVQEKQTLLEESSLKERSLRLLTLLQNIKDKLQVQSEIRTRLSDKFGKMQREQILREQLKLIREELGEVKGGEEDEVDEFERFEKQISDLDLSEDARKLAKQQLKHLRQINSNSPDFQLTRSHLEFLLNLPWGDLDNVNEIDLKKVRAVLDEDHYGLEKVKRRIVQHLAVLKKRQSQQGSLLLLVGPPGVGKTSLGQSIARALGRSYVRASLGGLRDDAEIRGHRRTYVGAMPGRILSGIKRVGHRNPVFVLDEIDKMSQGWAGDPASTLLEVLDPEQNSHFQDHYLDTGFDLSKVFFIGTANSLEGIPRPLLDRMEVIDLGGYTLAEKVHIARKHLIPKQMREHGISEGELIISDAALNKIITTYTREAGVRELQRKIASVCRWSCEKVLVKENGDADGVESLKVGERVVRVDLSELEEILGPERFRAEIADAISLPGVVTGMAWTPSGGDILLIETAQMPGTGQLLITGQLGDVMKESAQIAFSLIKSQLTAAHPGVDFSKQDVHIHVPSGAIPKDGPSAGITMVTAMASLFLRTPVSPKLAMTGEVTLRGAVMPVGGIKEKVLAAHRAGISTVILPKLNEKDLNEVPREILNNIKIHFVETAAEVLKIALGFESLPHFAKAELPTPQNVTGQI